MSNQPRMKKAAKDKYEGREYLDYEEAGDYLGMKRATLFNYIDDLKLETHKFLRDRRKYLAMADVKQIEDVVDKPWLANKPASPTQNKLPMDENATIPLVEEKPIPAIPTTENASICNVERFEDMPPGSMKRKAFVDKYGIHNPDLGKWLELGLKGDRLPVTYYPYHGDKAAAFNPEQQKEVLTILKRHNKLKGDING